MSSSQLYILLFTTLHPAFCYKLVSYILSVVDKFRFVISLHRRKVRGTWVQTRHVPTPLGVIFHNTDLNHLGFPLERDSVPLCEGVSEDELEGCFFSKGNRKKFVWDSRDFNVKPEVVIQYIERFVLFSGMGDKQPCNELNNRLDEKFVLYNVWCVDKSEAESENLSVMHYYHNPPPITKRNRNGKKKKKKNEGRSD